MWTKHLQTAACWLAAVLPGATEDPHQAPHQAPHQPPIHPREYWATIAADGYRVPNGEDPHELLVDLHRNLGSQDSTLRDDYGYGITAQWVYQQGLLSAEQNRALVEQLLSNLERGIGEQETDSVLLRSFSALNLSLFAARDLQRPFLDQDQFEALLQRTLRYFAEERDLRGRDNTRGWIHSAAHTADVLKFLARSPRLSAAGQDQIVQAIAGKLTRSSIVFTYGEDERMAQVLLSALARDDWDIERLHDFIDALNQARRASPGDLAFNEATYRARQNAVQLLRTLFVRLAQEDDSEEKIVEARAVLLRTLREF